MRAPNRSRNAYLNARRLEKLNKRASMLYGELAAQGDDAWRAQTEAAHASLSVLRTEAELLTKLRELVELVLSKKTSAKPEPAPSNPVKPDLAAGPAFAFERGRP